MEDKIEKVFERRLVIRKMERLGDSVKWGVFYGDRLICTNSTKRAARIALENAEELRLAIYDVLFFED